MKNKFKPKFHFTPRKGYMNDPNGLIFNKHSGLYHLFFQYAQDFSYDEYFGSWVEKNWGHATSADLIHWQEKNVAIKHDDIGLIWSGSCEVDRENASGFFPEDSNPEDRFVCAYACANKNPINNYGKICCCLGFSEDGGENWKKSEHNPVIANTKNMYDEAFGDPKIFYLKDDYYENGGIWVMLNVFKVRIFTSRNLKDWIFESQSVLNGEPFCSECPDLFEYEIEGIKKWIYSGAGKYYIVGNFSHDKDGKLCFIPESEKIDVKIGNIYATQHFNNMPDGRIVQISWMGDHSSLDLLEEGKVWDGYQSIPLNFSLYKEKEKYGVQLYPVKELNKIRNEKVVSLENCVLDKLSEILGKINLQIFDLDCLLDLSETESFLFEFRKGDKQTTRLMYSREKNELEINTYLSGKVVHEHHHLPVKLYDGKLNLRLLCDTTVFDLFAQNGKVSNSMLFFPNKTSCGFAFTAEGNIGVEYFNLYSLDV
jgi:fructan beta-fructosidase